MLFKGLAERLTYAPMTWMDLFNQLLTSDTPSLGILEIVLTFLVPFFLTLFIAWFYKSTSKTNNYSVEFLYGLILFSSLTAMITLLIGSNIARAFGLVAALSLIRFRTALKSPLDAIYMFWALAIGMACGTGFYLAAILITVLGITGLYFIKFFRFGERTKMGVLIKVTFDLSANEEEINSVTLCLEKSVKRLEKVNMSMDSKDKNLVYNGEINLSLNQQNLLKEISQLNQVRSIKFLNQDLWLFTE